MSERTKGMLYVTLAAVCWSVAGVCCKWIPWNNLSLNGVRALLAAAMMALLRGSVKVRLTKGNILGALATAGTSILFITSSKLTTAANAIVLQYAMPVYVILFCWLFYKQRPGRTDIITCVCIFAGVVLCSWEGLTGGGGNTLGDILALLAGVCFSLVFFCSRMPAVSNSGRV